MVIHYTRQQRDGNELIFQFNNCHVSHVFILSLQVWSTFNWVSFLIKILIKNLNLLGCDALWLGQYNPPYLPEFLDCLIILKMKAIWSFETSPTICPMTQRQMTGELNLHKHLCEIINYSTKCLKWSATKIKFQNITVAVRCYNFEPCF